MFRSWQKCVLCFPLFQVFTAGFTDVVRKPVGLLSFLWHPNLPGVDINQWLESFWAVLVLPLKKKGFLSQYILIRSLKEH